MRPLVLLGCGYTLSRLAASVASERLVLASTRDPAKAAQLHALGATVHDDAIELASLATGADVVDSIPPEAGLDPAIASALPNDTHAFVYLSSTGVYGSASGVVDEDTPVDPEGYGRPRIEAERLFQARGAILLRAAGIYGPGRGLHERLRAGAYTLPGEGAGRISRIHVDDLCSAILAALERAQPGAVFNVADDAPVPQREVIAWLCERLRVPFPPSIPKEAAPPMLRGDRAIVNARLRALGWSPRYPSYREGFTSLLEEVGP